MKKQNPASLFHFLSLSLLLVAASPAFAQSAAISYKGQLTTSGTLASGPFDMQFTLFDTAAAGSGVQKGSTITNSAVPVANGVFTVTLDFGGAVFDGTPRFLEISVRPGSSASPYTTLDPRQQVASIPYAIQSLNAATAATALTVASGSVVKSLNDLKDNVTLEAGPNATITKSGNTLTIDSKATTGGGSGLWSLAGTDAYYNAGNVGIGTSTPANKLTVRTPTLGYGLEHTDGDIRLSTLVGRGIGYLGTLSNHKLTFFANNNGLPNMTMTLDTAGAVGLGTDSPTPGIRLEVIGATLLKPGNGNIQFGSPATELGMSIIPTTALGGNRADLRLSGSTLKLVAGPGPGPPPPENGIAITTAGNVGIGTTTPVTKLHVETSGANLDAVYGNATGTIGRGVVGNAAGAGAGVYGRSATGPAIHADGNATQARDKGGFVKAMAYIDPFLPAAQYVVRCYNSQQAGSAASTAPCGITVTRLSQGYYTIDFGFNVEDRFVSLTPRADFTPDRIVVGMVTSVIGGKVEVLFERIEASSDTRFYIIVY